MVQDMFENNRAISQQLWTLTAGVSSGKEAKELCQSHHHPRVTVGIPKSAPPWEATSEASYCAVLGLGQGEIEFLNNLAIC